MNQPEHLRILFLCTQMEAGGVQVLAKGMLDRLQDEGFDCTLVFLYKKRPVFEENSHLICLVPTKPHGISDYVRILIRLATLLRRSRPTAIVGFAHYSSPLAAIAGWAFGAKKRVGTQTNSPNSVRFLGNLLDWISGTFGFYTANIAASNTLAKHYSKYPLKYRQTLSVVHNGILRRDSQLTIANARRQFAIRLDVPLLVTCGRLSRIKNQVFLFDVLELLPTVHLAILGEGELREEMEIDVARRKLNDRVTLVGEVTPGRVPDFLRCGDIFVFPSRYEAFGLAVAEAMLAGLPVISSNCGALEEVVGDAGVLLPTEDAAVWASAIQKLLDDPVQRAAAAEKGKRRGQMFGFDAMLDGFKDKIL